MKKVVSKLCGLLAAMVLAVSCVVTVFPVNAYAADDGKVQNLRWDESTYKGYWDSYPGATAYWVELSKDGRVLKSSSGNALPGVVSEGTSKDFTNLINGAGEYTFTVRAYMGDTADTLGPASEPSPAKTVAGELQLPDRNPADLPLADRSPDQHPDPNLHPIPNRLQAIMRLLLMNLRQNLLTLRKTEIQ